MPAPLVYVLGTLAVVGVAIAFKEFVYEPHLRDRVGIWVDELQEGRRRRRNLARPHAAHGRDSGDDVNDDGQPLVPIPPGSPLTARQQRPQAGEQNQNGFLRRRRRGLSDDAEPRSNDSDDERYGGPHTPSRQGAWASPASHHHMSDIELAELAPETREWSRHQSRTSTLNQSEGTRSPLDESNHSIPFVPLQPFRSPSAGPAATTVQGLSPGRFPVQVTPGIHVIANDDDSPASTSAATPTGTPSMTRRMQSLPKVPEAQQAQVQAPSTASVLFSTNENRDNLEPTQAVDEARRRSVSPAHTELSSLVTSPPLPSLPPISHITPTLSLNIPGRITRSTSNGSSDGGYGREPTPTTATATSVATPVAVTPLARTILPPLPSTSDPIATVSSTSRISTTPSLSSTSPTSYRQTFRAGTSPSSSRTASSVSNGTNLNSPPSSSAGSPTQRRLSSSSSGGHSGAGSPPLRPSFVPSLSQIYPQELESEHNIVLLSPPSSRSESPFSVISTASAAASPRTRMASVNAGSGTWRHLVNNNDTTARDADAAPRTPGSTATTYRSLADSDSSSPPASTPTSPSTNLRPPSSRHEEPASDSDFDFDMISDTTSLSGMNSPTDFSGGAGSPFATSPFASPRVSTRPMGGAAGVQQQQFSPFVQAQAGASSSNRPVSPAISTTSTTSLSELEFLEHEDAAAWETIDQRGNRTLRRFGGGRA